MKKQRKRIQKAETMRYLIFQPHFFALDFEVLSKMFRN